MNLQRADLILALKSAGIAVIVALLLLAVSLLASWFVAKRQVSADVRFREHVHRSLMVWMIRHFVKLTLTGLVLAAVIFATSSILIKPVRFTHRLLFMLITFAGPITAFLDAAYRLIRENAAHEYYDVAADRHSQRNSEKW